MKVAIYLRVSTEEQRERQSIQTQRDFAERYCAHQEIPIVDFYADNGVSGTVPLDQRPQGARMVRDARDGKFGAVLVYKLDRLGRESLLILQAVQKFQEMGIPIKSMTESIEADTPEGEFNLTILSGVATLERKNILRRSAEGIGRLVREGAWVGGVAPYGYRVKGRHREARLVVSDVRLPGSRLTESDVIRLVFRMAGDEGKSCLVIADALNQLSVPAALSLPLSDDPRGKRRRATAGLWRDSRIQYILRNPTYKGVHIYGKRPKKPGKKRAVVERPVAAIVDTGLWERAQETLKRNRLFCRRNSQRTYLLRGLMKCAHCGWTYVGTVYTSVGRPERPYYVCGGRHKGRKIAPDPASRCRGMAVTGDIEDVIWADVERFVRNPGPVLEELLQRLTKTTEQGASAEERLDGLRSSLAGKDAERERLIGLFRRGRIDDATLDKELDEVEAERNDLRAQIQALESEGDQARAQEKDLVTAAQLLAELNLRVGAPMTQELKRQVIEKLVAGVIVETLGEGTERDSLVRVTYRFGVPEPSIDPCTDRGIRVLQTLALPLGYAASRSWGAESYSAAVDENPAAKRSLEGRGTDGQLRDGRCAVACSNVCFSSDGAQGVLGVSPVIAAEHQTHIAREPEAVFDYFADLRNEPDWNHGHVRAVRMTSPPPIGQGTTFEGKHPGFGDATWRLVEYDRPHHLVIEGFVGTAPYRYIGDFRPTDGGTEFRGRVEWEPRGFWRSLGPLLHPLLQMRTRRSFRNLRVALERSVR